jgi:hypothetical protein
MNINILKVIFFTYNIEEIEIKIKSSNNKYIVNELFNAKALHLQAMITKIIDKIDLLQQKLRILIFHYMKDGKLAILTKSDLLIYDPKQNFKCIKNHKNPNQIGVVTMCEINNNKKAILMATFAEIVRFYDKEYNFIFEYNKPPYYLTLQTYEHQDKIICCGGGGFKLKLFNKDFNCYMVDIPGYIPLYTRTLSENQLIIAAESALIVLDSSNSFKVVQTMKLEIPSTLPFIDLKDSILVFGRTQESVHMFNKSVLQEIGIFKVNFKPKLCKAIELKDGRVLMGFENVNEIYLWDNFKIVKKFGNAMHKSLTLTNDGRLFYTFDCVLYMRRLSDDFEKEYKFNLGKRCNNMCVLRSGSLAMLMDDGTLRIYR